MDRVNVIRGKQATTDPDSDRRVLIILDQLRMCDRMFVIPKIAIPEHAFHAGKLNRSEPFLRLDAVNLQVSDQMCFQGDAGNFRHGIVLEKATTPRHEPDDGVPLIVEICLLVEVKHDPVARRNKRHIVGNN
ncbi:MAG: hypothetical protein MJE68_29785 [Proteobacteria bacterium]|nr:hypothetical protein [Pseudomonadota bacterium]